MTSGAKILIVDADAEFRAVVRAMLDGHDDDVVEAASDAEALALAPAPALVVLGVTRPGGDGDHTVRQLKARPGGALVQVVLVTERPAPDGLAAGADSVLGWPVDGAALRATVANLVRLRQREADLARRTRELDALKALQDETLAMLVHDLKSPLAVILLGLDYALDHPEIVGDARDALTDSVAASRRLGRLISSVLETAQAGGGCGVVLRRGVPLPRLLDEVLATRRPLLARRDLAVTVEVGDLALHADRELLARVVENLLDRAIGDTPVGGGVRMWATATEGAIELRIGGTGPALPTSAAPEVFDRWSLAWDASRTRVDLGLYFCRLTVEAHGGRIWVEATPDLPAVFALRLPIA